MTEQHTAVQGGGKSSDGGAAYPMPDQRDPVTGAGIMQGSSGLTKRDYFAAAFMAAMLGRDDAVVDNKEGLSILFASVATMSLDAADALIAASKEVDHA